MVAFDVNPSERSRALHVFHVTYAKYLPFIASRGLQPGSGMTLGGGAGYDKHSRGRVFFTEHDGLIFWLGRLEEHANDRSEDVRADKLVPVILRARLRRPVETDEEGGRDAASGAYFTTRAVAPHLLTLWDGSKWIPVEQWRQLDQAVWLAGTS